MPKPIPTSLAETTSTASNHEAASADVMRVLGGIGLPGEQDLDRMGTSTNIPEFDGSSAWQATVIEAHDMAQKVTAFTVPELAEFTQAGVDFGALQTGHEAYETAGMKPELVLFPVNLSLDTWKEIYSELRKLQDLEHPDSDYKLLDQSDGDGLYVWDIVADNWESLNQQAINSDTGRIVNGPGEVLWKAVVVPTASREEGGLAVNTSFDLSTNSETFQTQVRTVGATALSAANTHMPIGAYLTLQGAHVLKDTPLLDKDTWTWNAGTFKDSNNNLRAPAARWLPVVGRVSVYRVSVVSSVDYIGVRLPVWG